MPDSDDLTEQIRAALHQQAQEGPEYGPHLHERVMHRLAATDQEEQPEQPSSSPIYWPLLLTGIVLVIVVFLLLFIVRLLR